MIGVERDTLTEIHRQGRSHQRLLFILLTNCFGFNHYKYYEL